MVKEKALMQKSVVEIGVCVHGRQITIVKVVEEVSAFTTNKHMRPVQTDQKVCAESTNCFF
jgi:uncharacterized protein with FMN-binding domain